MANPEEIKNQICGWGGLVLVVVPLLKLVPVPWFQVFVSFLSDGVAASCGATGSLLLASTNKIIKK